MRRWIYASASLFCFVGVIAAWVEAQETSDRGSSVSDAGTGGGSLGGGWQVRMAAAGQRLRYSAAEGERPDAGMLAADTRDLSRLHSVLKQPESPAAADVPAAGPAGDSEAGGDTGIRTATRAVDPLIPAGGQAGDSTAYRSPDGAADSQEAVDETRVSSRRTFQRPRNPVFDAPPPAATVEDEPGFLTPPATGATPMDLPVGSAPAEGDGRAESLRVSADLPSVATSSLGSMLQVETLGPTAITVGEEALFVIRVTNSGDTEAMGLEVQAALPESVEIRSLQASLGQARSHPIGGGTAGVHWAVERLGAHDVQQLALRLVPQGSQAFDLAVEWSLDPVKSTARVEVQEPKLAIALSGPSDVEFGETKVYSLVVSNPGNGPARDVSVDVRMGAEAANTLRVSEIPAGGKRSFEMEVTAKQKGVMRITAVARGASGLEAEASHEVAVRRCDLRLEASGPAMQYAGTVGVYRVRLSNQGNAPARNVRAAVRLPQGVKYLEGLPRTEQEGDTLAWSAGELAPGGERRFEIACELQEEGDLLLPFVGQTGDGLQVASQVRTRVDAVADLKLAVNDPKGPIRVGRDVVYEIHVMNRGSKAANAVKVVAQFSEGIEPTATENDADTIVPGQVIFQPIAKIAPGDTIVLKVTAKAEADGNHIFRAAVECKSPQTRLVAEDTTQFYGANLQSGPQPPLESPSAEADPAPRVGSSDSIYGSGPR